VSELSALRPSNAKLLYADEKTTELEEIKEEKYRKIKWKNEGTMLLLWLTSTLSVLEALYQECNNSSQHIDIRVNEVT